MFSTSTSPISIFLILVDQQRRTKAERKQQAPQRKLLTIFLTAWELVLNWPISLTAEIQQLVPVNNSIIEEGLPKRVASEVCIQSVENRGVLFNTAPMYYCIAPGAMVVEHSDDFCTVV